MTINIANSLSVDLTLSVHYLIYRIDNKLNGRYYIGKHITNNVYDRYVGSGLLIQKAVKKYGQDNFIKTILFDLSSIDDMNNKEKELVLLSNCFPYDPLSYNLKPGGNGGSLSGENNPIYGKSFTLEHKLKISNALKGRKFSDEHKKHISKSRKNKPSSWSLMTKEKQKLTSLKLSKALKLIKHNDEWNKKISSSLLNRTLQLKLNSYRKFINTLHNHTEEELKQIHLNRSKSGKGRKIKDTTNMSCASRKMWNDPNKKQQMLNKRKLTYEKMSLLKRKEINLKKGSGALKIVLHYVIKILNKNSIDISTVDLQTFPLSEYKQIPKDHRTRRLFLIENWLKLFNINIDLVNLIVRVTNGKKNIKVDKNHIPPGYVIGLSHNK